MPRHDHLERRLVPLGAEPREQRPVAVGDDPAPEQPIQVPACQTLGAVDILGPPIFDSRLPLYCPSLPIRVRGPKISSPVLVEWEKPGPASKLAGIIRRR